MPDIELVVEDGRVVLEIGTGGELAAAAAAASAAAAADYLGQIPAAVSAAFETAAAPGGEFYIAVDEATDTIAASQNAAMIRFETWALLAAMSTGGLIDGQGAKVHGVDAGTHTDPVVGGTVNNVGVYRWSASPAGWKRIANLEADDAGALLRSLLVGPITPAATGSAIENPAYYFWPTSIQDYDQWISAAEFGVSGASACNIVVCSVEVDGSLTLLSNTSVETDADGLVERLAIFVPAGCVVGVRKTGGGTWYYQSGTIPNGESLWYTADLPTTSTAKTAADSNGPKWQCTLLSDLRFKAEEGYSVATETAEIVGASSTWGWDNLVNTGTNTPSTYSIINPVAEAAGGYVTRVRAGASAGGAMTVFTATLDGLNATLVRSVVVSLIDGVKEFDLALRVDPGEYVGVSGGGYKFQNAVNPTGTAALVRNGPITSESAVTLNSTHRYEIEIEVSTGLVGEVAFVREGGLANLVAEAQASTLAEGRSGLWGPGEVTVDGEAFYIPAAPTLINLYDGFRAAMMEHAAAGDVLTLIGDSLSHFAYAPTGPEHWFNRLTRFANLGVAADEPIMTALRPSSTYTPAFYGVTYTGTVTTGARGPLGETAILADGAVMTFVGAYERVGVFYTQEAGAGSLAFSYNGDAAFHTVNAAGATALDQVAAANTGQTASGTITITASGGPVEITGLIRLGVKAEGSGPRLRTSRAAHGSYTFANFGAAPAASILAQATYGGGVCVPIIALGINDSFGTDPATIVADATALINALEAGGASRIYAVMPIRPTSAWDATYTGGRTYDAAMGPLRKLYRQRGVMIIPADMADLAGRGLLSDGLHMGGPAQAILAQMAIQRAIAAAGAW